MDYTASFLKICNDLPSFCLDFFSSKDSVYSVRTKQAYALDLRDFFSYIVCGLRADDPDMDLSLVRNMTLEDLEAISGRDINAYLSSLTHVEDDKDYFGKKIRVSNSPTSKKRKLSCIRAFFAYACTHGLVNNDPTTFCEHPKLREKEISTLTDAQQEKLLKLANTGSSKSERARAFHKNTKYRDVAIITMFLRTGLRVSELVSLNYYDIDFEEQQIMVQRKGGKRQKLYFNREVLDALTDYIDMERNHLLGYGEEELGADVFPDGPLFVSNRHQRMSVRMVQQMVSNYGRYVGEKYDKVSPHALRRSFGTALQKKENDLYLTQTALGHSSPETTMKYYAKFPEERLKKMKDL